MVKRILPLLWVVGNLSEILPEASSKTPEQLCACLAGSGTGVRGAHSRLTFR